MRYEQARASISSGDLLAWSHRGWNSWYDVQIQAVRLFTRSEYCHVGVAWCIGGRVFALEAVRTGVRIFPLSRLLPFYWVSLDEVDGYAWAEEVELWALRQVGEPYSRWQAVLAGLGMLRAGEDSIWQCAEYAHEILLRCGMPRRRIDPTPTEVVLEAQRAAPNGVMLVEEAE